MLRKSVKRHTAATRRHHCGHTTARLDEMKKSTTMLPYCKNAPREISSVADRVIYGPPGVACGLFGLPVCETDKQCCEAYDMGLVSVIWPWGFCGEFG